MITTAPQTGYRIGTFSIAARCTRTGQLGVATATAAFGVGAFVLHTRPGVGAVATQAFTNPYLAKPILDLLEKGVEPAEAASEVLTQDAGREMRQLAVVNSKGHSSAITGSNLEHWAGHVTGDSYAIAGNTLAGSQVVEVMAVSFRASSEKPLGERLITALEAGQAAGGDKRGRQSAALYITWTEDYGYCDLRVDDHIDPLHELRRLWHRYQTDLEPVIGLFPTRSRPAGELDVRVWREPGGGQRDE